MAPEARRPTSGDVARAAGVSRATVSYVLNDTPGQSIPEQTRARVLDAVSRLGYTPSASARSLRRGRTDQVLCLLPPWPVGPVLGRLVTAMSAEFQAAGLVLLVHHDQSTRPGPRSTWSAVSPAAVVSFAALTDADRTAVRAAGVEAVVEVVGPDGAAGSLDLVGQRLARLQVEHLAARGHRRLGFAMTDDPVLAVFALPRLRGAQQVCAELGLDAPLTATVPLDPGPAVDAVDAWRTAPGGPVTGVCAYNDEVALAVLAAMRRRGLRAPGDLAVIGNDDVPVAPLADPPLSTVKADVGVFAAEVRRAVQVALRGEPPRLHLTSADVELVVRESA